MSVAYTAVQWNRSKRLYDTTIVAAVAVYLCVFIGVGRALWHGTHAISPEILALRALGSCAFLMLHVILAIGPLARLDRRFLPWLYNRRHLGVSMFLVALAHAALSIGYYHGFGNRFPILSVLTTNTNFTSLHGFPFELLGVAALFILFLMAATSHDFWLKNIGPDIWKYLHMGVYVAYALLVLHVALGALVSQRSVPLAASLVGGAVVLVGLHCIAGWRESRFDDAPSAVEQDDWLDAGNADEIPLDRARTICSPRGERIAVFRHAGGISAVENVCAHQRGPLGEGKVIDGCITCPWHGWQYRPADGQSPPPFAEKIKTYAVRVSGRRIEVKRSANPPGTFVQPACITEGADV